MIYMHREDYTCCKMWEKKKNTKKEKKRNLVDQ